MNRLLLATLLALLACPVAGDAFAESEGKDAEKRSGAEPPHKISDERESGDAETDAGDGDSEEDDDEGDAEEETESTPPPVGISGHAMFRYTSKFVEGGRDSAEIYNLRLYLDRSFEGVTLHAEPRFRQTPLRSFSPSNIWIQQAWIAFDSFADSAGTLRAGLVPTRQGLAWDHSWFGNLVYLNGLKLDPDYGLELFGAPSLELGGDSHLAFRYGVQFLPVEDGLNGFFAPGFKQERLNATPNQGVPLDFDSAPGHTERHIVVGEFLPTLTVGDWTFRTGISARTAKLGRQETSERPARDGRQKLYGAESKIQWRGLSLYGEVLREEVDGFGDGVDSTDYLLGGVAGRWNSDDTWLRGLEARVNGSRVYYRDERVEEWFFAPGVHVRLHQLAGITAEYVRWQFDGEPVTNRIEWILHGYF